jgi:phospholipid/cholesterol/gamma-HCH transport system permease protein
LVALAQLTVYACHCMNATIKKPVNADPLGILQTEDKRIVLYLRGAWHLSSLAAADALLKMVTSATHINGASLTALDTAAAGLLLSFAQRSPGLEWEGFSDSHQRVLSLVRTRLNQAGEKPATSLREALGRLGVRAWKTGQLLLGHIDYLGRIFVSIMSLFGQPKALRWRETASQFQQIGLNAMPVVMLVTFLIGIVFAYLLGLQAQQYGANLYVVDGVAIGMARELAPIIVATIVAGRSGAAFTAQLGTMRLTEEIDAIRTLGLSPMYVLVLPRVLAITAALPLLVFLGNVASLGGAMAVCASMLEVTPTTFIERVHLGLDLDHVYAGLIKAPAFALAIAVIGCRMGMSVSRDTRSIGMSTTSTVVQSIVAVILLDAGFAVFFEEIDF